MTPLPTIPNVFRCAFDWVGASGLTAASVLHFRTATGNEADVFSALDDNSLVAMFAAQSSSLNCIQTTITQLDGSSAAQVFPAPSGFSGAGAGEAIAQAACIVSFSTGIRGPANRGRIFIPFVGEGEQQAGFISGTTVSTVHDAWVLFASDMNTNDDCQLVVASYVHATANDVIGIACKNVCGTIKKRVDRQRP